MKKSALIVLFILILDQILKIWIKTTFYLGESHAVLGQWFFLHFTENEGMAYGMKLGGANGKLLLSLFRIAAVVVIIWWLYRVTRKKASNLLIVCISLILAGALGNIIDSAFYGLLFSESTYMQIATLFPPGGGYGTFLHGKVVDMLYFPIIETRYPIWFPFVGGEEFLFFRPVFNVADSAITTGVLILIVFQKKIFPTHVTGEQIN
ncbi:MAG TPA: lipoprotein signal peptidase [Bacteroidales bacterium]|nr:lipoprotein signal peptidase [Bacteroidales bacterium]HPS49823.1 lipoprotein signal peptidase [Bacteroidales bacterium]